MINGMCLAHGLHITSIAVVHSSDSVIMKTVYNKCQNGENMTIDQCDISVQQYLFDYIYLLYLCDLYSLFSTTILAI